MLTREVREVREVKVTHLEYVESVYWEAERKGDTDMDL